MEKEERVVTKKDNPSGLKHDHLYTTEWSIHTPIAHSDGNQHTSTSNKTKGS